MRIISWNVNSVRLRIERLTALIARHDPDVICLQETKTVVEKFPYEPLEALGYRTTLSGQKGYNGVAIISKAEPQEIRIGFAGDPLPNEARVISAKIAGLSLINVYVVNGQSLDSEKFQVKLAFFDALRAWLDRDYDPEQRVLIVGDFNVAPDDRDVHDPEIWRNRLLCSDEERGKLKKLCDFGLRDLHRQMDSGAGHFTWWDYRFGAFGRDRGLRIDLALGSEPVCKDLVAVSVDKFERKPSSGEGKPSDHAPLIVDLA